MTFRFWPKRFASRAKKPSVGRPRVRGLTRKFDVLEDRRLLSGTTWWVGSVNANFADIQSAVNSASVHNGDTIKVEPGTYDDATFPDDTVTVNKSLTILGGQPRNSTQHGASVVTSDAAGFTLVANNITVQNFTIHNALAAIGMQGILTDPGHSGYKILNNIIQNELLGVELDTVTTGWVSPSTVSGNRLTASGIVGVNSGLGARNATICNNTFSQSNVDSVSLIGANNVGVINNQMQDDGGIFVTDSKNCEIRGNVLTNSNFIGSAIGIELAGGVTNTDVINNSLHTNSALTTTIGISLDNGANSKNRIWHNTVVGFNQGLVLDGATNNTISNNTITNSKADGIDVLDASTLNTFSCNTVSFNGIIGINVVNSSQTSLFGNTASNNQGDGIYLRDSNKSTVWGNTASNNGGSGIEVDNSVEAADFDKITWNTANGNQVHGILIGRSDQNTISDNTVNRNTADGIRLTTSDKNKVTYNTAKNNGNDGIILESDATGNTIAWNAARNNVNWDLEDQSTGSGTASTANTWTHNTGNKRSPTGLR